MNKFIPWGSQPLDGWAEVHARGKFLDLDGHRTHYLEKGQGPPVILIHGFFFDTHLWDRNLEALAAANKVYVLDLWGFGYSTREMLDFGYPLYARQLELFMDALDLPKAIVIGQSMGGGTIIKFAVNHSDRIKKMILVDPAILPNKLPLMGKIANLPVVGEFLLGMNNDVMRKVTLKTTFFYDMAQITPDYFNQITCFQKVKQTNEIMLKILRKRFFDTLTDEVRLVGRIGIPTLIVAGQQSKGVPIALSRQVHEIIEGSRLEVFDRTGHCPNLEQPERFNSLAVEFLKAG